MTTSYTSQVGFRGRSGDTVTLNDNTTWAANQNTNWSQDVDTTFRIRLEVEEQNNKSQVIAGTIEYRLNGGSWVQVTTTSSVLKAVASSQFNDGDATTNVLTASAKTFTAGEGTEDAIPTNVGLQNTHLEHEYALQIVGADVANNNTIEVRLIGINNYAVTPSITVIKSTVNNLTANNIVTGSPVLGSPTISVIVSLTANNIATAAPVLGSPDMTRVVNLTAVSVTTSAPTLGPPTIGQTHVLTAVAIATSAPTLASPTVSQIVPLVAVAIATGAPTLGQPTLTIPQFARPIQDITLGTWTPSSGNDLYAMIDEEPPPSDADYIRSGGDPSADICEVKFSSVSDPDVSYGYVIRYRAFKVGTGTISITFRLMEGATERDSWTISDLSATPATYQRELSQSVIDSIVDHTNLRLRMEASLV